MSGMRKETSFAKKKWIIVLKVEIYYHTQLEGRILPREKTSIFQFSLISSIV